MKDYIRTRATECADYIIANKTTVRDAAKKFAISKSTVHKDVSERLARFDYKKYLQVKDILEINLKERHIRGGISTQKKFKLNV